MHLANRDRLHHAMLFQWKIGYISNFGYKKASYSNLQQLTLSGYESGNGSSFSHGVLNAETFYTKLHHPGSFETCNYRDPNNTDGYNLREAKVSH